MKPPRLFQFLAFFAIFAVIAQADDPVPAPEAAPADPPEVQAAAPAPGEPPAILTVEEADRLLRNGRAALEDGLLVMAEADLARVRANSPDRRRRLEATLWLARAWVAAGRPDDALSALADLEDAALRDPALHTEITCIRAEALAYKGEVRNALGLVAAMSDPPPRTLAWGVRLAAESDNLADAIALHDRIPADAPELPAATLDLAEALSHAARTNDAAPLWTALAAPAVPADIRERATWFRLEKDAEDDAPEALAAIAAWADEPDRSPALARLAYRRLARASADAKRFADAFLSAKKAATLSSDAPQRLQDRLLLAQLQLRSGDLASAATAMHALATEIPLPREAAAVQRELACTMLEAGAWENALREAQLWLDAFEGDDGTREIRVVQAEALSQLGRADEAADVWQRIIADIVPSDYATTDLFHRAADALYDAGRLDDARAAYQTLYEHTYPSADEDRIIIRLCLADIAIQANPSDPEGERILQELIREPGIDRAFAWDATLRLGQLYETRGADDLAEAQYGRIADATDVHDSFAPFQARALLLRGLVRHRAGNDSAALEDFSRILDEFPSAQDAPQARYMRAWCLHAIGRDADARAAANALLADPASAAWAPRTRYLLAEQAYNAADYPTATNHFIRLATDAPDSPLAPDALYWAARADADARNFLDAERILNLLIARYPDHPRIADALLAQGDVLCELGNFSAAIAAFTEVINDYPRTPQAIAAWGRKGDAQFTLGQQDPARYEEALLSFRTLREYPATPADLRLQADYKIGRCLEKTGHHPDAVSQYMTTAYDYLQQDSPPPESAIWFTRSAFAAAALQEAAGNWREAIGIYQRVAGAGVPAAPEAIDRIRRIRDDHWFQLPPDPPASPSPAPAAPTPSPDGWSSAGHSSPAPAP